MRRVFLVALVVAAFGVPVFAQSPLTSGLRGRVIIAKELLELKEQPVDPAQSPWYKTTASTRRRSGRGVLGPIMEPAPELLIVLEGEKPPTGSEPRPIHFHGMRFIPSSLLVPKPARLKVYNDDVTPLTVEVGGVKETIAPGESAFLEVPVGKHELKTAEFGFARAELLVLDTSIVLPVKNDGLIDPIFLEPNDYQLGFYWGATPLQVQAVTVPDGKMLAIDASVSANRVVTVSMKDGGLQVALPPPTPRSPTPPPKPTPVTP